MGSQTKPSTWPYSLASGAMAATASDDDVGDAPKAVYALTNAPAGNAVVVYSRRGDGSLTPAGSFPTGGNGSGAGLGSQDAVIVSDEGRFVFAVNAGSNSVSSFRIREGGLELVDTAPSGGSTPTSVSFHDGLLYVLNAGVPNNVSGLTVSYDGELTPLAGSTRPLSGDNTAPAQVGFSDDGDIVIVSERATNRLVTYTVGGNGLLSAPTGPRTKAPSRVMDAVKEIELTDRTSELFRFEEKIRREEAKVAGKAETAVSRLDLQFEALVDEETNAEVEARLKELAGGTATALPVGGSKSS